MISGQGLQFVLGESELPGNMVNNLGNVRVDGQGLETLIMEHAHDLAPAKESLMNVALQVGPGRRRGVDCVC